MAIGHACDALARALRRDLPFSAIRVKKFCGNSQIVSARAFSTGFRPAYRLEQALAKYLASEFRTPLKDEQR
jgi:hypothetical protein